MVAEKKPPTLPSISRRNGDLISRAWPRNDAPELSGGVRLFENELVCSTQWSNTASCNITNILGAPTQAMKARVCERVRVRERGRRRERERERHDILYYIRTDDFTSKVTKCLLR